MSADDRRLITECLKGHPLAFAELIRRHQDRLYNTVYRLLDNEEDAKDVVQETFIHAFQGLDGFKGDAQFSTWLHRIAINAAYSLKRKQRVVLSIETGRDEGPVDPADPSEFARPDHALEQAEQHRRLQDALNRLSPEHRAVLVLKDIEEEKYDTIAEMLGVPIGTVRSRLHRARLELREILGQDEA